jgi:Cd2+/Zn2+-exporting ATPase
MDGRALDLESSERVEALEARGDTVLVLFSPEGVVGLIAAADEMRPEAPAVVRALRAMGVEHVIMLTGDSERTAAAVAERAGVTEHRSRLLPEDKVAAVRELKARYGVVAMVGDGVNDAPALASADVGIAMGASGSDTALETADVALMSPDIEALPGFLALGRRTVRTITANVAFSVATKAVVLVLAVLGFAPLWLAVFADTGVSLIVTMNGLRLLRAHRTPAVAEA